MSLQLDRLKSRGFDRSIQAGRANLASFHVGCTQCEPAVINGIPCHEQGCPNARHECRGCNAQIPSQYRYCQDCQS